MASTLVNLKKKLQWSDFGPPANKPPPAPGQSAPAAYTFSNYNYSAAPEVIPGSKPTQYRLRDSVRFTIQLKRPPSWVAKWVFQQSKQEQIRLLSHEQGHYDLVALLVRDMFIEIMQLKLKTYTTAQAVLSDIAQIRGKFDPKIKSVHGLYDHDTKHGLVTAQQTRWDGFMNKAFTKTRTPLVKAPDGATYKVPLLTILNQASIHP